MQVKINGKLEETSAKTVAELLYLKEFDARMTTVELNGVMLDHDHFSESDIHEQDEIELVFFMGGGKAAVTGIARVITEQIGNTPVVELSRFSRKGLFAKVEMFNPGGSVKDRICISMINAAEAAGRLTPGATVIEPTSGNTGIGLALVSAIRGYKLILVMPESMSLERASLLSSYGAQLVMTPAWEGMRGSIKEAENILERNPHYFMPNQFSNPANPEAHRRTTGPELLAAFKEVGEIDAFVVGVGTGGTITGTGEILKAKNPNTLIVAVEPAASPVLSGGEPGPHKIQGMGAGFIPAVLNRKIIDRVVTVTDDDAYKTAKTLARQEGLLVGISSGANAWAAKQIAEELGPGKIVVTVLPDTGERYISIEKYFNI